ncbi:hypothetical protein V5P93_005632 [Actinokineospora auranticolor]|uniref:S1 motif domain-containing protein n=1 Tax=Actinokineospora auranticolor TaxID=155976 RepID=A0A2S6GEV5_9PSEU|nr:hypothetical protein [Actinokineospora auranticolor]PPK63763.1 hypothetical protein CLV40_1243 [Actinokineospora auranticolor]
MTDIHDLPVSRWGHMSAEGTVVEVRVVCAHHFGLGVQLTTNGAYGHIDVPRVSDGRVTTEDLIDHIGQIRRALVLMVDPGRQPKLTIRRSDVPETS